MGGIVLLGGALWHYMNAPQTQKNFVYQDTKFGNYLAMKHAIWTDDFDAMMKFSDALSDSDVASVQMDVALGRFLAGHFDDSAKILKDEKSLPARVAYIAYLLQNDDWKAIYKIVSNDKSALIAPIRIWAAVANDKESEAFKFIDSFSATDDWKLFARGMVYAETNRPDKAKASFDKVPLDFFNLNDFLYLTAFYEKNNFKAEAAQLRKDFAATPGGAYVDGYDAAARDFSGVRAALAFSLIQNVSHTPALSYTGAALVLLRLAQAADAMESDAINYYLGMFFYNSDVPKYKECFDKVKEVSPYYPFVLLKNAEKAGNFRKMSAELQAALKKNPAFMPALQKLVAINLQKGRENDALRVVNNAFNAENLSDGTRAYLLRLRSRVYMHRGDLRRAEDDILKAGDLAPKNPEILLDTAKIWAAKGENLDQAYLYATEVIKIAPTDLAGWDTLAMIVWAKEGTLAASDILERVSGVASGNSSLFQHLGDVRAASGNKRGALEAYQRALTFSDDGLSCGEECLRKKIKSISP